MVTLAITTTNRWILNQKLEEGESGKASKVEKQIEHNSSANLS